MELVLKSCGEFRWSPEGPVSQIHSPHLHVGAPGFFSDLLRSVQMLTREWVQKWMGSYCTYLWSSKGLLWQWNLICNINLLDWIHCLKCFSHNVSGVASTPISSTAVGQVVACAPVTQWAQALSPFGKSFLGEVLSGFFLTCKTNVGKL